jgi:hypothetical protein
VVEGDEHAVGHAGRSPCLGEQEQGEQAPGHRLVRHELDEDPGETDRLTAEVAAQVLTIGGGRQVALVEDQVDRAEHGREPRRQRRVGGHRIGDARGGDLALGG